MKLVVLLCFLSTFLSTVVGKRVSVDIMSSSQQLVSGAELVLPQTVSNKPDGCREKNYDGTCVGGACDCPSGSVCVSGDPTQAYSVSTCQTQGKAVHQGAGDFDFEAANIISVPTQVPFLDAYTTTLADGTASAGKKDKYHLVRVKIQDVSMTDKYTGCEVTLDGSVVSASTVKPVIQDKLFSVFVDGDDSSNNTITCEFRPTNKGYLGLIRANVTFLKNEYLLDAGEKPEDAVEVHFRYVPGVDDDEWHDHLVNTVDFAKVFPSHDPIATTEKFKSTADNSVATSLEVFRFNTFGGDGFDVTGASALKGTLKLPITGTFFDARYLVVDQTGVESLKLNIGSAKLRKEGLEIHFDFKDFYDASKNAFDNTGIQMNPVSKFSDYDSTNLHVNLAESAQYLLQHTYVMTYGGYDGNELPHFMPDYLGCELCPGRIVVKAFKKSNAYTSGAVTEDYLLRYHGTIDATKLPTSTNTVEMDDVDVDVVAIANGHATSNGQNIAMRLPSAVDPQNPDGHALSEFFTVKTASTKVTYPSLIAPFDVLGTRLTFDPVTGSGLSEGPGCANGAGKLYQLGQDIAAKAQDIFIKECKIKIDSAGQFGRDMKIVYTNAASVASTAYLRETDKRSIVSGNTELSLLRRKEDTSATTNGPKVTFQLSKLGVTGALSFTVKGSNTMVGYAYDGTKCTAVDLTTGCHGVIDATEETVTTDAADGVSVSHTIRSSPDCFLFMDVELVDTVNTWASYALRLPCVRSTTDVTDSLSLKYVFSGGYNLATDQFTGKIEYDDSATDMSVLEAGFGNCGTNTAGKDQLYAPSTCKNLDAAHLDSSEVGHDGTDVHFPLFVAGQAAAAGWSDVVANEITLGTAADVDLLTLKRCDNAAASIENIDDTNKNYGMVHSLGLTYSRDLSGVNGAGRADETYCHDQKFITTIARDATATTSVTTLVAPSLERSVMVSSIDWIKCESTVFECAGSDNCYKLQIDLNSKEKNVNDVNWDNSSLTDAFDSQGGANTDNMLVVHSLSSATPGNLVSLVGVCGVVPNCSMTDPGTVNHWYDHTATNQDIVVRGTFENIAVDTVASITTAFQECPLQAATTDDGGVLKIGMTLVCQDDTGTDAAVSTVASDVTDANGVVNNCKTALASSIAKVESGVYVDTLDPTGATAAADWTMKDIDWRLNRYEAKLDGSADKTKLISSDLVMEMRYQSGSTDWTCTRKSSRITGLPLFNQTILDCDPADLTTSTNSGTNTGLTHAQAGTLMFDLQPLQMASMDAYEVEVTALIQNVELETRRLRKSYTVNLQSGGGVVDESVGFQVIDASNQISDDAMPVADPDAPVGDSGSDDATMDENADGFLILGVVITLLIAGALLMLWCMYRSKGTTSAALATVDESKTLIGSGLREKKYSDLRY